MSGSLSPLDVAERDEVWGRQPEETAKSYEAFAIYRDLGAKRSFAEAYRRYSGRTEEAVQPPGFFYHWTQDYLWKERAEAFDLSRDKATRRAIDDAYAEAFERIAQSAGMSVAIVIGFAAGRRSMPQNLRDGQIPVSEAQQLIAARDLLDRLGVSAPKRLEVGEAGDELSSWAEFMEKADEIVDEIMAEEEVE